MNLGLGTLPQTWNSRVTAALNSITCDGNSILVPAYPELLFSAGIAAVVYAWAGLGMAAVLGVAAAVVKYQSHKVLRAASVQFLFAMLVGFSALFASAVLLVLYPTDATCRAFTWLLPLGFAICYGPLFAKNLRVYLIFSSKTLKVKPMSQAEVVGYASLVALSVAAVLVPWAVIEPLRAVRALSRGADGARVWQNLCTGATSATFSYALVGLCGAWLVTGSVLAFRARNVASGETFGLRRGRRRGGRGGERIYIYIYIYIYICVCV